MRADRAARDPVRPPFRIARRLRSVIAQDAHQAFRAVPAVPAQKLARAAPAGRARGEGRAQAVGIGAGHVESLAVPREAACARLCGEPFACALEMRADRVGIGDGAHRFHAFGRPFAAHRFEHEGLASSIGEQKGIVIFDPAGPGAIAPLSMHGEERRDDVKRLCRACRPLQPEPHEIHAEQRGLLLRRDTGEHRLVADDEPVLVGAHFRARHPEGLREQHRMGLARLRNLDIGAGKPCPRLVAPARRMQQVLRLIGVAVGILGKKQRAARCLARTRDQCVAHLHLPRRRLS